jgi:hypothetical protein
MAKTKLKSYENIILNHHWADIELTFKKTYGHDKTNHDKFTTNVGWKIKYLTQIEYNV